MAKKRRDINFVAGYPGSLEPLELSGPYEWPEIPADLQTPAPEAESPVKTKEPLKRVILEVTSEKRRTAGFHIYPEHEKVIHGLARLNPQLKNKGEALEFIVEAYLKGLQPDKRLALLKFVAGEENDDQW